MQVFITVFLLNVGAFALSRLKRVESTISYLIVLMASMNIIYFGSLVDKLKPATIMCFILCAALFRLYLIQSKGKSFAKDLRSYCNVHTSMNIFSGLLYTIILKMKQPTLYYWDEIRIWGPTAKAVKQYNRLYSIGINPTAADRNYPRGNALLNYLYSFFTEDFSEIILLVSYAMLFFAVFSAASKLVEIKTKNTPLSIGTYFMMALLPFLQNYHTIDTVGYGSISYAYGTSMVDFNVAIAFFAVLILYFYDMDKFWYIFPSVFLISVKKNGIFFALLAFCIIMCFEIFVGKFNFKKIKKLAITLIAALIVPLAAYQAFNMHLDHYEIPLTKSRYSLEHRTISYEGEISTKLIRLSEDEMLVEPKTHPSRLSLLIDSLTTDRYFEILDEMKWYFRNNEEIVYVKDKHLIAILLIVGLFISFFTERKYKIPVALTSIGLTVACFVYNRCIAYQMQFYTNNMVEYPRYMVSYYYGWLYVILLMVVIFLPKHIVLNKLLVYALVVASVLHLYDIGVDRTILDAKDNVYANYIALEKRVEPALEVLEKDDMVLLVWMSGYDNILYEYTYYLQPAICNKDVHGTGINFSVNFRSPETYKGEETFFNFATAEEFSNLLKDYFDYVYICNEYDWDFENSYNSLFEGGISKDTLYRVTDEKIPLQRAVCDENIS